MLKILTAAAVIFAGASAAFAEKATINFAHLSNPGHEAALYAIEQGIVTSDKIDVKVTALDIAALQQAIVARTFDVVEAAPVGIPRAKARGLDLQIIGTAQRLHEAGQSTAIWVKQDSPIQTVEDLKGKRLGGYTLSSAGMTLVRIALNKVHGLNIDREAGDVQWVELPEAALAAALAAGNVDASVLIHAQAYEAMTTGDFRPIVYTTKDMIEKFGLQTVTSVLVGYGEKLMEDPESYQEFLRMFRESVDYALANQEEVFAAVGEQESIDPKFLSTWFNSFQVIPVYINQNDLDAIDMLWAQSTDLGVLDVPYSTALEAIWEGAVLEGVERQ